MNRLSDVEINEFQKLLNQTSTNTSENRFLHRLHCIVLVGQGCSYPQVSEWFGEHPRTIERWVHRLREYGLDGLKDDHKSGRPTKLDDDQKQVLENDIVKQPFELGYQTKNWNGQLLKIHLKDKYGIDLGLRQCQRLLGQLKRDIHSSA